VHVVLPGPPETATGGFAYDRRMIAALAGCGRLGRLIVLPDRFPDADLATRQRAQAALQDLPAGAWLLVDGLCLTPLMEVLRPLAVHLVALIHHLLGDESGLAAAGRAHWLAREQAALASCRAVITTSGATARRLRDLGVPAARITVVPPGVDAVGHSGTRASRRSETGILCVGGLSPRKGQDVLVRALGRLRHLRWRLILVGPHRDRVFARRLQRLIQSLRLGRRIEDRGVVANRARDTLYRQAFVLVLPSRYEGYGMVLGEAIAAGLPVIASALPAIPEAVPATCRLLLPVGDVPALARAIERLLRQPARRHRLAAAARREAPRLRQWGESQAAFLSALKQAMAG
jgi:glycosyltransferase involved in cell wall biosynthesis